MTAGRPTFEPSAAQRRTVRAMAAYGIPHLAIAGVVGVSGPTLRKHFRIELDTAEAEANAKVAECLFRKATGEGPQSVTAAIFWLKCRAGWREFDVEPTRREATLAAAHRAATGKYAIRPPPPGLGKKARADWEAQTAGEGTGWGDLLRTPPSAMLRDRQ